jgi:hypothetical protein
VIGSVPLHVELIGVKVIRGHIQAKNLLYQGRIDAWLAANEDERPRLLHHDRKLFFIHVTVYAA